MPKKLELTIFEPGEIIGTVSKDGKVAIFTVNSIGALVPSDNRLFDSNLKLTDPIETLNLGTRPYQVLKREGINTIGEVFALYDERGIAGFDNLRNLGEKSRDEIVGHIQRLRGQDGAPNDDTRGEQEPAARVE